MTASNKAAKRILVVDDQKLVREAVKMMLAVDGYDVETAAGAEHALAVFEAHKYDVVMVDFEMPKMKGDRLAVLLKERAPRQPIIMLTGHEEQVLANGHAPAGIDHVIKKPFRLETLREGIARASAVCAGNAA
jgi:CheY-like chemotaxis protein